MKTTKRTLCGFYLTMLIFFLGGCSLPHWQIPELKYPAEMERTFNAPFDQTWESVLEVVKISDANIITEDKTSGIVVCTMPPLRFKLYTTIFVKKRADRSLSTVYFTSRWFIYGPSMGEGEGLDREFFKRLQEVLGE